MKDLLLAAGSHVRFEDSGNSTVTGRHYDLFSGKERLFHCDTEGNCIKKPTEFFRPNTPVPEFTLRATRKVLNLTYHLEEESGGARLGTLDCKGRGALWKISEGERELARIVDPTKLSTSLVRTALGGSPDTYCLVRGEDVLATIDRLPRPHDKEATGRVGRFFQKLLTLHDWALCIERDLSGPLAALSLAGTLLLIEHQIRTSGSL